MGVVQRGICGVVDPGVVDDDDDVDKGNAGENDGCGWGEEIGYDGIVESWPEVVYGVRSRTSGNITRQEFLLECPLPKCIDRFKCNARTRGGY